VSRKTALIVSFSLLVLFAMLLGISLLVRSGREGMEVRTQRKVSEERILQGGNPLETAAPVMPGDRIDINTADAETLQRLPGIGEKLAEAILTYRNAHGPFPGPEALKNVDGIGEELYSRISPYLTAGDGS
jgi:competence protein ComEA